MRIIDDIRVLRKFERQYNMRFDRTYKYCLDEGNFKNSDEYRLQYYDGCFKPYLTEKEHWYHFAYESGSNPYIACTTRERDRILKKYKGKVRQLHDDFYFIFDK